MSSDVTGLIDRLRDAIVTRHTIPHGPDGLQRALGLLKTQSELMGEALAALTAQEPAQEQVLRAWRRRGEIYKIAHDGFEGDVIGIYLTREDKAGVVLQQLGTRVVHVYGEKWLGALAPAALAKQPIPGEEKP